MAGWHPNKSIRTSKKAQIYLVVLAAMLAVILLMLYLGLAVESLELPFNLLTAATLGYFGSQMAPDAVSAYRGSKQEETPLEEEKTESLGQP